jgi:lipocalin
MSSVVSTITTVLKFFRSGIDCRIIKKYNEFVPEEMAELIRDNFDIEKFTDGPYYQVATSASTILARTGPFYSDVKATYRIIDENSVSVLNEANDDNGVFTSIQGVSRPRKCNDCYEPGIRTVVFNANERYSEQMGENGFEGDYHVIYATPDMKTIVVGIPLIEPFGFLKLSSLAGHYILTKDPVLFWSKEYREERYKLFYYLTGESRYNQENNQNKLRLKSNLQTGFFTKPLKTPHPELLGSFNCLKNGPDTCAA